MASRIVTSLAATVLLAAAAPTAALAQNPMGYRLLSAQEAAALPHNHGALGLDIERSQEITDAGMTFDIIRIRQVRSGSPGAQAGLRPGDQIIAVDGRVFPTLATFAAYVGAMSPGTRASIDYIPAGGGPAQAERVTVIIGASGPPAQSARNPNGAAPAASLSTGDKVAIGVGAAALLGCYELGCFSHRGAAQPPPPSPPPGQFQR